MSLLTIIIYNMEHGFLMNWARKSDIEFRISFYSDQHNSRMQQSNMAWRQMFAVLAAVGSCTVGGKDAGGGGGGWHDSKLEGY